MLKIRKMSKKLKKNEYNSEICSAIFVQRAPSNERLLFTRGGARLPLARKRFYCVLDGFGRDLDL